MEIFKELGALLKTYFENFDSIKALLAQDMFCVLKAIKI